MKHYFITSAPIEYAIQPYDLYDSFDLVSQGKINAPLRTDADTVIKNHYFNFDIKEIKNIYCNTSGQTHDTAVLIKNHRAQEAKLSPIIQLNNIRLSMNNLIPKHEFEALPIEQALKIARREFVSQLYDGQLPETLEVLKNRMDALLSITKNIATPSLFIGHAFFLKLLQIYFQDPSILNSKEKLLIAFNPDQKPFKPLTGFEITN